MKTILECIQNIGEQTMGADSFPSHEVRNYAAEDNSRILLCYGPDREVLSVDEASLSEQPPDTPVYGFCIGGVYTKQRVATELYAPLDELHENTPLTDNHYPIAYYRDTAVHPKHQSQGIGNVLTQNLSSHLLKDATSFITPIWHRDDGNMQDILEKYPIDHLYTFSDYNLHEDGSNCPVCSSEAECTCTFSVHGLLN